MYFKTPIFSLSLIFRMLDHDAVIIASCSTTFRNDTYVTDFSFFHMISNETKVFSYPHDSPTLSRTVKCFIISFMLEDLGLNVLD